MIKKDEDLLGTLIHDVAHLLRLDIDKRLSAYNLTRVKWLALGIIHDKSPMSQSDLAKDLELGAASVGRLVDRLEERGFVRREIDPNDRRSFLLTETARAKTLVKDLGGVAEALREDSLKDLSAEDVTRLQRHLKTLKQTLRSRAATASALICLTATRLGEQAEMLHPFSTTL